MNKVQKFECVCKFLQQCYDEEMKLTKYIDGERDDSDGLIVFQKLEELQKIWIAVFFNIDTKCDDVLRIVWDNIKERKWWLFRLFKLPSIKEIDEANDKMINLNIPIIKAEYLDKTYWSWINELIDTICPEGAVSFNHQFMGINENLSKEEVYELYNREYKEIYEECKQLSM